MKSLCLVILSAVGVYSIEHDFKGFDDSILFGINWPGTQETLSNLEDESSVNKVYKVYYYITRIFLMNIIILHLISLTF